MRFGRMSAAEATAARADLGINASAAVSFRNRIANGNFGTAQRGGVIASTTYAAGAYVVDRWKAGTNGCTCSLSVAANGDTTVSITVGSLVQILEGKLYLPEGGAYLLSWQGTATARAYQGAAAGSYAAGTATAVGSQTVNALAVSGLTAGTNTGVEFSTGTVSLVQLEPGASPTPFERRDDELRRCQRYFRSLVLQNSTYAAAANAVVLARSDFPDMARTPSLTLVATGVDFANGNVGSNQISGAGPAYVAAYRQATAAGLAQWSDRYTLDAEISL